MYLLALCVVVFRFKQEKVNACIVDVEFSFKCQRTPMYVFNNITKVYHVSEKKVSCYKK